LGQIHVHPKDGNDKYGADRAKFRGGIRTQRWRRPRNESTSASTDMSAVESTTTRDRSISSREKPVSRDTLDGFFNLFHEFQHLIPKLGKFQLVSTWQHDDHRRRQRWRVLDAQDLTEEGSKPAPNTVSHHRVPYLARNRVRNPRGLGRISVRPHKKVPASQVSRSNVQTIRSKPNKFSSVRYTRDQADSLWRPLRRRFFRISRPARVDIRWRKPCFFDRLRTFG
jgi:hypothetical protein